MISRDCTNFISVILAVALVFGVLRAVGEEMNAADLADGLTAIAREDEKPIYSICVVKNDSVETRFFQPSTRCHNCYSIAKLFTLTAIGILEDRGLLSVDDKVYPLFQDQFPPNFDPKWKDVRICDVLTHRIGFEKGFLDIDVEDMRTWGSDDFLALVLSHPIEYPPGTRYVYSDAAFYLASRIFSAVSDEMLDDFLIRELANPLGFAEFAFSKCPKGYPIGATGLYLSTEDVAKLGKLYVQNGNWEGKQILSEDFVEKAFRDQLVLYPVGDSGNVYAKGGMNGQLLYMNRKTGTVCAIHSFCGNLDRLREFLLENDR